MKKNRTLIIGFGYHAQRIHSPIIRRLKNVDIVGIVDLRIKSEEISSYLSNAHYQPKVLYVDNEDNELTELTNFAKSLEINSIIISTGPEHHVKYGKWGILHDYHILMDKPVHAIDNAALDSRAAVELHDGFIELYSMLLERRKKVPNLVCEILTQRRFHPAYKLIRNKIQEVYEKTLCPITYYYAFHNDGQWRLPGEIKEIEYHGFNNGYGKASHSGYHFFDLLNWFSEPYFDDKKIDSFLVKSWPNFPTNYLHQVDSSSLQKVFSGYRDADNLDLRDYGEIDVMNTFQLMSSNKIVTHAQIDLLHSGFSARTWPIVGDRNLYKGNGRVRHEQHYIAMGPFMSVSLTSWQSKEFSIEDKESDEIYRPGHEYNLDITICRNKLLGGEEIENYSLMDLYKPELSDYSRGHQEDARRQSIIEFFNLIDEKNSTGISSLESHKLSSQLMSGVYQSISSNEAIKTVIEGA